MKRLLYLGCLCLLLGQPAFAQQATLPADSARLAATYGSPRPVSDSLRRAVHRLFRWGRLAGAVGGISGGMLVGSGATYAARGERGWLPGISMGVGGFALVAGIVDWVRFSPRRERAVLAALERGRPLPPYVLAYLPLLPASKQP